MAIFKGQVPFEIPNDEDDSKFTDEENLGLKKIQYCFGRGANLYESYDGDSQRSKRSYQRTVRRNWN